ncbi:MAG TPA: conjugal transfer protein TraF [Syntrophales bacterium]|nr:conjugal transfer protein TraF [Syntrophales bacterium]
MFRVLILCQVVLLFTTGTPCAGEPPFMEENGKAYYGDAKRGWWWYEKIPLEKRDRDEKVEDGKKRSPRLSDYTMEELWNMYPDDFQAVLMAFQKKAVQVPSENNVREYYVVQDIARRKSLAFANVSAAVMQKYPDLSVAADYPITAPGRNAEVSQRTDEIESRIRSAREEFALIYFSSAGCPYCAEEGSILSRFVEKYGWEIREIDIEREAAVSSVFGIETTPTLLLIYRGRADHITVSAGVASLAEIEEKLYRGIRLLKNEITPEEYSLYEFQRGGAFDVKAPLRRDKR